MKAHLTDADSDNAVQSLGPSIFFEVLLSPELSQHFKILPANITAVVVQCVSCPVFLQQLRVAIMMTNLRSNRNKAHLGLGALLIALCFISWLVLLGGIAAVQKLGE